MAAQLQRAHRGRATSGPASMRLASAEWPSAASRRAQSASIDCSQFWLSPAASALAGCCDPIVPCVRYARKSASCAGAKLRVCACTAACSMAVLVTSGEGCRTRSRCRFNDSCTNMCACWVPYADRLAACSTVRSGADIACECCSSVQRLSTHQRSPERFILHAASVDASCGQQGSAHSYC